MTLEELESAYAETLGTLAQSQRMLRKYREEIAELSARVFALEMGLHLRNSASVTHRPGFLGGGMTIAAYDAVLDYTRKKLGPDE